MKKFKIVLGFILSLHGLFYITIYIIIILLQSTPTVIIKRGAQGAIGKSRGGSVCRFPAAKAVLVDSTGAGDSFAGGYIASWIENQEVETAILAAIQVAARCVAIVGARPQVTTAI